MTTHRPTERNETEKMPKLPAKTAKEVEKAEAATGSFKPVDPGLYRLRLTEVTVGEGDKGPYWTWIFEIVAPKSEAGYTSRLWHTTSLSANSRGFLKAVFAGFGVSADTDTDELCGEHVMAEVGLTTIKKGDRAGDKTNVINSFLPDDPTFEGEDEDGDGGEDGF